MDISIVSEARDARWTASEVEKAAERYLGWHFKGGDGRRMQFDEVMIVKDGYLRRIKKGVKPPR